MRVGGVDDLRRVFLGPFGGLDCGVVRQAEDGQVGVHERVTPFAGIPATLFVHDDQIDVLADFEPVADPEAGCAVRPVYEYL